jgi:hypothetical protein
MTMIPRVMLAKMPVQKNGIAYSPTAVGMSIQR